MISEPSVVCLVAEPPSIGDCDLCGSNPCERQGAVVVRLATGAAVQLAACDYCVQALRRISAASGGLARFVLGEPPARVVGRVASDRGGIRAPAEQIHEYSEGVKVVNGPHYTTRAYGQERTDGTWAGWLEFHPTAKYRPVLRTGQETSQPDRGALVYWASGLEPVYLEGAFTRAHAA